MKSLEVNYCYFIGEIMTIIGFNLKELKKENRFKVQEKIFKNGLKVGCSYSAITLVQTGISLWNYQIILICVS